MRNYDENETVQGYTVRESVHICGKDYVLAENLDAVEKYVTWQRTENELMASFDHGHYFSGYLEAMLDLTERVKVEAQFLLEMRERNPFGGEPLTYDICIEGSEHEDYTGQFVLLKATSLSPEYRTPNYQLFKATNGFGCSPDATGTKVYGDNILSDESERWRRSDIAGIIDYDKVPEICQLAIDSYKEREKAVDADLSR